MTAACDSDRRALLVFSITRIYRALIAIIAVRRFLAAAGDGFDLTALVSEMASIFCADIAVIAMGIGGTAEGFCLLMAAGPSESAAGILRARIVIVTVEHVVATVFDFEIDAAGGFNAAIRRAEILIVTAK
jgi:hypothetical protein